MSPTKSALRSSLKSCIIAEESYCAPWDLKVQEQKLKSLNEQHQSTPLSCNSSLITSHSHLTHANNQLTPLSVNQNQTDKCCHKVCTRRTSSTTRIPSQSFGHVEYSPPMLPPLPPGGFTPSCSCGVNNNVQSNASTIENLDLSFQTKKCPHNSHGIRSGTDTSRSFLFALASPSSKRTKRIDTKALIDSSQTILFEENLPNCKHLSSSVQNNSTAHIHRVYEQPWDQRKTLLINNLSSTNSHQDRSLQPIPCTEQLKQRNSAPTRSSSSTCRHAEDLSKISIDTYSWYHHTMSRRQAEHVLQWRPTGSFLVRQSESGDQNDYSLSIRTVKGCMHMRISYSAGCYILGECSRPFSSVSSMIKYFSQTSVPVRGATHIQLGMPVSRWEILSSLSLSNEELL